MTGKHNRHKGQIAEWQRLADEETNKHRGGSMPAGGRGLQNLKTACKAKLRCKPKVHGEEYLRMYLATKEEERLVRYRQTLYGVLGGTDDTEVLLADEKRKLRQEVAADLGVEVSAAAEQSTMPLEGKSQRRNPRKPFTKVTLDY